MLGVITQLSPETTFHPAPVPLAFVRLTLPRVTGKDVAPAPSSL